MRWIAVDWGTTRLRASLMDGARVVDTAESNRGMGKLDPSDFEPALLALIEPWLQDRTEVLLCGMAGARSGWYEAPYGMAPIKPGDLRPVRAPTQDARLDVRIVPGVKQTKPRADVMRGEETQIAGFLHQNPNFDGVLCLPGTHTKWAHISAEEIVSFQTFMTGEMFALLSQNSVLRHSVAESGWDDEAFGAALSETLSRPETLAAALFALRASDLLEGTTPEANRARLTGLLLGAELAAARPYWLGQQVALIGAEDLCAHYAAALNTQGVPTTAHRAADMTRAGLAAFLTEPA